MDAGWQHSEASLEPDPLLLPPLGTVGTHGPPLWEAPVLTERGDSGLPSRTPGATERFLCSVGPGAAGPGWGPGLPR